VTPKLREGGVGLRPDCQSLTPAVGIGQADRQVVEGHGQVGQPGGGVGLGQGAVDPEALDAASVGVEAMGATLLAAGAALDTAVSSHPPPG